MIKPNTFEGIVLAQKPLFEKDKRVELCSPTHGKITVLAKYAQSNASKFGGKLEPTMHVMIHYFQGKSFKIITQCDLIKSYPHIRTDYSKIMMSHYLIDLIKKASDYDQENIHLFQLFQDTLEELNNSTFLSYNTLISKIHHQLLFIEGLIEQNKKINTNEFKAMFEEYTGHHVMSIDKILKG